ncbi:MAG: hypothetical protein HRT68_07740 [Flavobacteriaceae bacterium]|nr:hypothetical protein [Flavobacteriaceae bacterium]
MSKILVLCFVLLLSCKDSTSSLKSDFKEIKESGFSIRIPNNMNPVYGENANENAIIQYQNIFNETYFLIIEDEKKDFVDTFKSIGEYDEDLSIVENYMNVHLDSFHDTVDILEEYNPSYLTINGLDAVSKEFDCTLEDVYEDITYFLTFVEGKEQVYMIMAWTLKDDKETHRTTFSKMAQSFKLTGEKKKKKQNAKLRK